MELNEKAETMEKAGESVIRMCVGEPDFDTPECINRASCRALEAGKDPLHPFAGHPGIARGPLPRTTSSGTVWTVDPGQRPRSRRAPARPCSRFSPPSWNAGTRSSPRTRATPATTTSSPLLAASRSRCLSPRTTPSSTACPPSGRRWTPTKASRPSLINSPANPTGTLLSKERMKTIAELAEERDHLGYFRRNLPRPGL